VNIIQTINDKKLFADQFGDDSWQHWRSLLAGFYGLKLNEQEALQFNTLTKRQAPAQAFNELWLCVGRRGGKSHISALLAVYEAFFNDYTNILAAGEVATVFVIAADRKQARSVMRYIRGMIESNSLLQSMVIKDSPESIELSNRCVIEIMTAGFKGLRGYSVACAILDEVAFWSDGGANPDKEILNAIRPSLATLNGKIIALSSPYARRGVLWENYKRYYGKDSSERVLVAQAPSLLMNNLLPKSVVEQAYKEDAASAKAEYGAEFRTDVETFISREAVDACVMPGRIELPPLSGVNYFAFTDPSGGSKDAFTMAIAHKENDIIVIDAIRTMKPPFSPESVVDEFCTTLKLYRISEVNGDRYAGEWPREQFRKRNINYKTADKPKSDLYRDMLPIINSGRVELLDNDQSINELTNLERRTARGGKDSIDHAPGSHDDLINSIAGVISIASKTNTFIFSCTYDDAITARGSDSDRGLFARGRSAFEEDSGVFYIN